MKIEIAGYNIDKSIIDSINKEEQMTPETISAAYARISRSSKSVTELRREALSEVEKARKSNENIIFDMGHSSIAEHAVFNIDLIGVSRFLTESIQKTRFASFTEKSQRYVSLQGDYVVPKELVENLDSYHKVIDLQNQLYFEIYEKAQDFYRKRYRGLTPKEIEIRSKEDGRYILSLATKTQMGMTINARSLENLLCRLDGLNLSEAEELKKVIEREIRIIAPSLIRYTEKDCSYPVSELVSKLNMLQVGKGIKMKLIDYPKNGDDKVLSLFIFQASGGDYLNILKQVRMLKYDKKEEFFNRLFEDLKPWSKAPHALESSEFVFQCCISSSCFAQLKRHRITSQFRSDYNPEFGYVMPDIVRKTGLHKKFDSVLTKTNELYHKLEKEKKGLGNYILTNSHKVHLILKANLRELYHFSRLRSDKHSQWEIRELSQAMVKKIKRVMPLSAQALGGKDEIFNDSDS